MLCITALLIVSCDRGNAEDGISSQPILLSGQMMEEGAQTKALITDGQALPGGLDVGVNIFEDVGSHAVIGSNMPYKTDASGGLVLQTGRQPYYPASGRGVGIWAYYPCDAGESTNCSFTIQADQSTDAGYNASDLLMSGGTYARSNSPLTLPFVHKMSRVSYELIPGADMTVVELNDAVVTVLNVQTRIAFMRGSMDDVETQPGNRSDIIPHTSAKAAIIAPQAIAAGAKLLKIRVGNEDYYVKAPAEGWTLSPGESLNLTVTVNKTGVDVGYTITDWTDGTVNDNGGQVIVRNRNYRVGDYYPDPKAVYDNGVLVSGEAATGVVFWVDPANNSQGKIVSLDETIKSWYYSNNPLTNARDKESGRANIRTIFNLDNDFSDYPALEWVHSKNDPGEDYSNPDARNVWYLPALNELQYLLCAAVGRDPEIWNYLPSFNQGGNNLDLSVFNKKLTDANGTGLGNYGYWTSTEEYTWYIGVFFTKFDTGSTLSTNTTSNTYAVRAILAF